MVEHETTTAALGLSKLGIHNSCKVFHNLTYKELAEHEKKYQEGTFVANGTFAVDTGNFTSLSPEDKFIVKQAPSQDFVWWGSINQPTSPEVFDALFCKASQHFSAVDRIYVFDGHCGVNVESRLTVRIITELAWQHHFVTNMFIRPDFASVAKDFEADFTLINACNIVDEEWKEHGLHSEVFVLLNIEKHLGIIGGTSYNGEMKKAIFSIMKYYLPLNNVLTVQASSNFGGLGHTALFFGLSGTGKTTLSANPKRELIGDDELGWDSEFVFSLEGGCYVRTINLSKEKNPCIYNAIRSDALLENVWIDANNEPDYFNSSKTEHGRPSVIIFLTCDAYGVLPPVAKLSRGQARYHFLSGYSAKVAGTERGITEPQATFSTGFGAAFMMLHPMKYATFFDWKLEGRNTNVYMINTGWTGGVYGVGKHIELQYTRKCVDAVLGGDIERALIVENPLFGFEIPTFVEGVPSEMLNPRDAWTDKEAFRNTAHKLATSFIKNYRQFILPGKKDLSCYGPVMC